MPRNRSEKAPEPSLSPLANNRLIQAVTTASAIVYANTVRGTVDRLTVSERPRLPPIPEGAPLIAVPMPTHTANFALYHVDVGVDYWYFEPSMAHAIQSHFIQVHNEGLHDDDLDDLDISRCSQGEAEALNFMGEAGGVECNMYEAGLRYGPGFIACSEY